ncbi:hypothetical protein [Kribbella catacumbae]|uniref:hypothetical protein n=1 Tax=Kribbella catacumbae TaxID=460086 RepID=UPI00037A7FB1|nr:hypothetical protein [Kribbella catacumbae]
MASTPDKLTIVSVRRVMALAGLGGALAGGVAWIAGWPYAHALTTVGLLIMVISYDFMIELRAGLGAFHTRNIQKFSDKFDPEQALDSAGTAVHHFRKLAAKHPAESWHLARRPLFDLAQPRRRHPRPSGP